jgi:histidinol-phosphate aminotransferase
LEFILNDKIKDLKPYDPITGYYPIRLDANESFLNAPEFMKEKISIAASNTTYNRYPDQYAVELCKSFASYYKVSADIVTAGNGSDELISIILNAFLMKGDTMMTVSPDFSMYKFYSSIVEAECIEYQKKQDLTIDVDDMIASAKENKVKLILFSNPCNPTSLGLKREEVRKLITSVDALVIVDEAYMDFWNESLLEEVEKYNNLIILRTCSKAFGMAGIRLGFAVANATLTNVLKAVKSPYNVNLLTQQIGTIILNEHSLIRTATEEIIASRKALYQELKRIEGEHRNTLYVYPSVTNFLFIKMSNSKKMFEALLNAGIAVRYMGDYLRISAGNKEENTALIKAFETEVEKNP